MNDVTRRALRSSLLGIMALAALLFIPGGRARRKPRKFGRADRRGSSFHGRPSSGRLPRLCYPYLIPKTLGYDLSHIPSMNFPAGRTAAQVVVIELDQANGIEEHAAVRAMVEAGHAVAIASRDTEGGVYVSTVSIVRTSIVIL